MVETYLPVFLILAIAAVVAVAMFTLTSTLGPKNPTPEKNTPYESGSESRGGRHVRLSVKFYLTAILFVVFDIEAVFLYPWATVFNEFVMSQEKWNGMNQAALIFGEMVAFLGVLGLTLFYAWKKGALEWEK